MPSSLLKEAACLWPRSPAEESPNAPDRHAPRKQAVWFKMVEYFLQFTVVDKVTTSGASRIPSRRCLIFVFAAITHHCSRAGRWPPNPLQMGGHPIYRPMPRPRPESTCRADAVFPSMECRRPRHWSASHRTVAVARQRVGSTRATTSSELRVCNARRRVRAELSIGSFSNLQLDGSALSGLSPAVERPPA